MCWKRPLKLKWKCMNLKNAERSFSLCSVCCSLDQLACHITTNGIPDGVRRPNWTFTAYLYGRDIHTSVPLPPEDSTCSIQHRYCLVMKRIDGPLPLWTDVGISSTVGIWSRIRSWRGLQFASKLLSHNPRFYPYLSFSINTCRWTVRDATGASLCS